jgi:hypothetical protein
MVDPSSARSSDDMASANVVGAASRDAGLARAIDVAPSRSGSTVMSQTGWYSYLTSCFDTKVRVLLFWDACLLSAAYTLSFIALIFTLKLGLSGFPYPIFVSTQGMLVAAVAAFVVQRFGFAQSRSNTTGTTSSDANQERPSLERSDGHVSGQWDGESRGILQNVIN